MEITWVRFWYEQHLVSECAATGATDKTPCVEWKLLLVVLPSLRCMYDGLNCWNSWSLHMMFLKRHLLDSFVVSLVLREGSHIDLYPVDAVAIPYSVRNCSEALEQCMVG